MRGEKMDTYIAHYRQEDQTAQLLSTHLKEVQQYCEIVGKKMNVQHIAGLVGMLHDFGKYSEAFQTYIREAIEHPESPPKRGSVNHSTAGGQLLLLFWSKQADTKLLAELLANVIYTHHGSLLDFINTEGESPFLKRPFIEDDIKKMASQFFNEVIPQQQFNTYMNAALKEYLTLIKEKSAEEIARLNFFLAKYLFSALIDADRTNARDFDENKSSDYQEVSYVPQFMQYKERLTKALQLKQQQALQNRITTSRQYLSDQCAEKATLPTGIYTLSIPTGGGKTLASLRFALSHVLHHRQQRIINIIPFTTIIEQNAKEVRTLLEADDLLEHHSNIIEDEDLQEGSHTFEALQQRRKMQSAKDNWESPLIYSTMVQFLNIIYAEKSRYTRRFHQLANSVIIFDEIQSLPVKTISLFNEAMMFLKEYCNTTIILCTATQPALEHVEHYLHIDGELIDELDKVLPDFKRTAVTSLVREQDWTYEEVAQFATEKMGQVDNLLIIVNTKTAAKKLYQLLSDDGWNVQHLSTSMCPAHRQKILAEMRETIKTAEKLICVSTQLIEAGVDVSFQCVIRAQAGLDSIAQAAGRCNRNGEAAVRDVYVINLKKPSERYLQTIVTGIEETGMILRDMSLDETLYDGDLLSMDAMKRYFKHYYYALKHELNYTIDEGLQLYDLAFSANASFVPSTLAGRLLNRHAFKTVGRHFHVIDTQTTSVIVPYEQGNELITQLEAYDAIDFSRFVKQAQQYSVNVFPYERRLLEQYGMLAVYETPFSKIYYVREGAYSENDGLDIAGDAELGLLTM